LAIGAPVGPIITSSPMDVDGQALLPIGVSPIDSLPLLALALPQITVEARVAGIMCNDAFILLLKLS
jgi:hypothetical protein